MKKKLLAGVIGTLTIVMCAPNISWGESLDSETGRLDKKRPPYIALNPGPVIPKSPIISTKAKEIEIVFVVDTTGSMGGLIQGAKTKIWNIVNEVMQYQKKGTKVKVGLVAYRDRQDDYVVKRTSLSEDLDKIYVALMDFKAQGGGDEPEDVRQALATGVNNMEWSKTSKDLSKIIFLVGDARPHTDYNDQPSTVETAKKAKNKGIIINTIQCGSLRETVKYWREIAQYAGGEYFAISQDGGTKTIVTPYDEELRNLSTKLDKAYIPYGSVKDRKIALESAAEVREKIKSAPLEAAADRAYNKSINSYSYSSNDLVQSIENGSLKLKDIAQDKLPENMQKMDLEEREAYINQIITERKEIREKIFTISQKRAIYIKNNTPKVEKNSFDVAVAKALAKQLK